MKKLLLLSALLIFGVLALSINVFAQSTVKIGNLEVMTEDLGEMKWEEAKKACKNLGDGWRLPSKSELNLLYKNKEKIGGFANSYYWSSTEYDLNTLIWIQDFVNGNQYYDEIEYSNDRTVRAVRTISVFAQSTVKIGNLEVMTEDLVAMKWEEAKKACKNLGDGWRLPSKSELNLLYKNKEKIVGCDNNYYWSSEEIDNTYAWGQNFVDGGQYHYRKVYAGGVRAVRAINVFAQSNKLIIINSEVESGQTLASILLPIKGVPYSVILKIIETSDFNLFDIGQKYQLMLNPQDSSLVSYTHSFSKENIIKVTLHPDLVIEKVLEMEGSNRQDEDWFKDKIITESYLFDKDFKKIMTVCEGLDESLVLLKEIIKLAKATSLSGASELQKQEFLTWSAKYYSFGMRIKELRLWDSFAEKIKNCSNYYTYESLRNKMRSKQVTSKIEILYNEYED